MRPIKLEISELKDNPKKLIEYVNKIIERHDGNRFKPFRVSEDKSHDHWMEWFLYTAIGVSGILFREFLIAQKTIKEGTILSELKFIFQSIDTYDYFLFPANKANEVVIGTKLKRGKKDVAELFKTLYLDMYGKLSASGVRFNMPEPVSENLYFLSKDSGHYYRYVNNKFNEKGRPSKSGDGFKITSSERKETEIKSTTSGGVRNTFSRAQAENSSEIIHISVDQENLRDWLKDNSQPIGITVYTLKQETIKPVLDMIIENKRTGSRYEFPTIKEIEDKKLYHKISKFVYSKGDFKQC